MEKETLTAFEQKCIQEEPAFCTAACPFHLDVKAFLTQMAGQDANKAFKLLEKSLPLPEIMARVCDRPCQQACIREKIDTPVSIGDLERACVSNRTKQKKYFPAPAKAQQIGVWGSGLSSLATAWDLCLKGYKILVFEHERLRGGHLHRLSPAVLPESILDREISRLEKFGVKFETGANLSELLGTKEDFSALYLGMDAEGGPSEPPKTDGFSLQTLSDPLIFAGGFSTCGQRVTRDTYPVAFAFQGRKAATSIDRVVSGVSLTAGREKEGPITTRLTTEISDISPQPALAFARPPEPGQELWAYDLEGAAMEARRCIQCDCSRCTRVCNTYLDAFKGFPGKYAREIYNNLSIVMGDHKSNRLINSCTLCDQCKQVCPNDFSMADLCLSARREMVETKKMPESAHEFALGEMAHALGDACFFARHQPGSDHSDRIFFPGCQLTGSSPHQVTKAYDWLLKNMEGSTGLMSGCCGAPAYWAGNQALFEQALDQFTSVWTDWGCPEIITACTSCSRILEQAIPKAKVSSLFVKLAEAQPSPGAGKGGEEIGQPSGRSSLAGLISVVDPCSARLDTGVREAVRQLADQAGCEIKELDASGEKTECCGFGGLVFNANPPLSRTIIEKRAAQSDRDYLTYCAMCRDRLAGTGKRVFHILDLFWPGSDIPGLRKDPGFSIRRINLARFRADMLVQFWKEVPDPGEQAGSYQTEKGASLILDPGVQTRLDEAFILVSDVQKVLNQYEKTGRYFYDEGSDNKIAYFRPANVCFWVEFREGPDSFEVIDGWSHRMRVAQNSAAAKGQTPEDQEDPLFCGRCKLPLVFSKNHVQYLGSSFDVDLPQCGACGEVYISKTLSQGKMAEVEGILEDK